MKTLSTYLCFLLAFAAAAQETGSIRGSVNDKATGDPLYGAVLQLFQGDSLYQTVFSDFDLASFEFSNLPFGVYTLKTNYIGCSPLIINNITVNKAVVQLKIEIEESSRLLESVVITSGKKSPARYKTKLQGGKSYSLSSNKLYISKPAIEPTQAQEGPISPIKKDTIIENAPILVEKEAFSTFSIDVDKAGYSLIRKAILQKGEKQFEPERIRIEELINYFDYHYQAPQDEHPLAVNTELSDCPWNSQTRLLRVGLQGVKVDYKNLPAANFVFLLDVSGSMSEHIALLKQSMGLLVAQLRPQDRVAIVVYAGAAGLVLPSTTGDQKEKILAALNKLEAGGSTAGGEGIQLAYKTAQAQFIEKGNNRVVLVTDGDFNVGISSTAALESLIEKEREKGIFLTVLGMGGSNYRDEQMETLADKGNGNYFYIDGISEANKVLTKEISGTIYTVAKDVKLQLEFDPKVVRSYRLVGYENRLLAKADFSNDKKDAGELGAGHSVTALYELVMNPNAAATDKVFTLRFRYKSPDATKSLLLERDVLNEYKPWAKVSEDTGWAAMIAAWGQLLRGSAYSGDMTKEKLLEMAKQFVGADEDAAKLEFLQILQKW